MQPLKLYRFLLFCCLISCIQNTSAQETPYLERLITIDVVNRPISEVFQSITNQTSVSFSYTDFNDLQKITAHYYKTPLRIVLDNVFKESTCNYKINGKYIIIHCDEKKDIPKKQPSVITGYVYNATDSNKIENVSVYIMQNKRSTLSNQSGFFSISYPLSASTVSLSFAKEKYYDTTFIVRNENKREVIIYLYPFQQKPISQVVVTHVDTTAKTDSVPSISVLPARKINSIPETPINKSDSILGYHIWSELKKTNPNSRNIKDTLYSIFSLSLLPYVCTNRSLAINTVNNISLNLLAGYSKGVNGCEIGGLLNMDNGDAKYFQIAGLGNVVAGNFKGFQTGGLFNFNSKTTTGMQMAGIFNYSKSIKGLQISSITNYAHKAIGIQLSVITNHTDTLKGLQLSGLTNISQKTKGVQLAPLYNRSNKLEGVQISGIINRADTLEGLQIAGLKNVSKNNKGCQIAGLINHTHKLEGVQLAIFNYADTATGIPIGFYSRVKKGYHKIELATDELIFVTMGLRTGVDKLHNIFLWGVNLSKQPGWLTYGYGLGTALKIKNKLYFSCDATVQQVQANISNLRLNLFTKLFVGFEYRPAKKFSIALGPTCNIQIASITNNSYWDLYNTLYPSYFYTTSYNTTKVKMSVGGKFSLKFL